jgi:hypothetical protein
MKVRVLNVENTRFVVMLVCSLAQRTGRDGP